MKRYEFRERPAEQVKVLVKTECDICGIAISNRMHDFDEVTIERKVGYSYPDGGAHTVHSFDLCGSCFSSKLEPFLLTFGAAPDIEEVDW